MQWRWNRPLPVKSRACEKNGYAYSTHLIYEAFAWVPHLTISGYWVWLEHYFKEKCNRDDDCKNRVNYRTVDLVLEELTK